VAIGTHDLDTVEAPFTFSADAPSDINFVPLTEEVFFMPTSTPSVILIPHIASSPTHIKEQRIQWWSFNGALCNGSEL